MSEPGVIHRARRVVTLDHGLPTAEAVAVRNGIILGVGTVEQMRSARARWRSTTRLPTRCCCQGSWRPTRIRWRVRSGPGSTPATSRGSAPTVNRGRGCQTFDQLIELLRRLDAELDDPTESLIVWGFDPIYFPGERLAAHHLDVVSTTRPICVIHASLHLITVNTALMER